MSGDSSQKSNFWLYSKLNSIREDVVDLDLFSELVPQKTIGTIAILLMHLIHNHNLSETSA